MSIFYLTIRNVNRADGRSAIGAAAYCSGSRLYDENGGRDYDFRGMQGLVHTELLLPEGAPKGWRGREGLWNEVEAAKGRDEAALAREVEAVIPGELSADAGVSVAREFVAMEYLEWGTPADLSVHRALGADGRSRMFAYVLSPLRWAKPQGISQTLRPWVDGRVVNKWRDCWARQVNRRLFLDGVGVSIGTQVGETRGRRLELDCAVQGPALLELRWRNGERSFAEPGLVLDRLLQGREAFTREELAALVRELTVGEKQYSAVLARVESWPEILKVGKGESGEDLFGVRGRAGACRQEPRGGGPSSEREQDGGGRARDAVYSGLRATVETWESEGLRVRGVGLTYELAKRFERVTGIPTAGVHGVLGRWKKKRDLLESRDVLIVNDVAELSDLQKEWMLKAVRRQRAKMVLVLGADFVVIDGAKMGLDARQMAAMAGARARLGPRVS